MTTKGAEIKSLKVAMGSTEVELTVEEARSLRDALDNLFGKAVQPNQDYRTPWTITSGASSGTQM